MDEILIYLEIKYSGLSKETRAQITFPHYVALRNPSWSEEDVLHGIIVAEEKRARAARWLEEQRNPTPIRSTQLCYSCKVPWEPNHRCMGKGKKHIIEVHYDSEDEVCEDTELELDAYLEQCDDASTEASDSNMLEEDSDSCTLVDTSDYGTLGEDGDPCVVDRQSEGQDDSTCIAADISHGVDDPTPQQSRDTSGDSHVLAPRDDELPRRVMTPLSSFHTPMIATSQEDISGISDVMEEPCVRTPYCHHSPLYHKDASSHGYMNRYKVFLDDNHEHIKI
jgi:hypothetical protein